MKFYLTDHIQKYIKLEEADIDLINEYVSSVSIKNKEYILEEGQICKSYFFVEEGCLRMFFYNDKGAEQTTYFALENWWITDFSGFSDQRQSQYNIQAVGKTEILVLDFSKMDELLDRLPKLEKYFRIVMQKNIAASQERIKLLYQLSKEELFLHFNKSFPHFVQKVPQYMLASFLGLTPEYLSEIRKKNC